MRGRVAAQRHTAVATVPERLLPGAEGEMLGPRCVHGLRALGPGRQWEGEGGGAGTEQALGAATPLLSPALDHAVLAARGEPVPAATQPASWQTWDPTPLPHPKP